MLELWWKRRQLGAWTTALSSAVLLLACDQLSGDSDEPSCIPGESRPCACADGREGRQLCNEDGTSLAPCECQAAPDAAAKATAPAVPGAAAPGSPTGPPASLPPAGPPGPATAALAASHQPDQATLTLWKLDEGSGVITRDLGRLGLAGTLRGTSWTAGRFGSAIQLNGSSANMQATAHDGLFPSKALTLEAWVRPEVAGAMTVFDIQDTYGLALRPRGSGVEVVFTLRVGDQLRMLVSTSPVPIQQWHHLAGTYNGTSLRLFIDGELSGELAAAGTLARARLCDTPTIGSTCPASSGWFNGAIDEVRISDVVRYLPRGATPATPPTAPPAAAPDASVATTAPDAGTKTRAPTGGRQTNKVLPNKLGDFARDRAEDARRILGL